MDKEKDEADFENIRQNINNSNEIILACDNDREGESICVDICNLFKLPIDGEGEFRTISTHDIDVAVKQLDITFGKGKYELI